jgi:hypothetical protein
VGGTTITATLGTVSSSTTLTVTAATLTSIAVTPAAPSIALGLTQQFTATGTYSDKSTQNLTASVTWASSVTAVATISNAAGSNGLASSAAVGGTTITATLGTVVSAPVTLTVTAATLTSIAVTPAAPSIALLATQQFTATGTYTDKTTANITAVVTWASSVITVATISNAAGSNGLATGELAGTSAITATLGTVVSAPATLTVL